MTFFILCTNRRRDKIQLNLFLVCVCLRVKWFKSCKWKLKNVIIIHNEQQQLLEIVAIRTRIIDHKLKNFENNWRCNWFHLSILIDREMEEQSVVDLSLHSLSKLMKETIKQSIDDPHQTHHRFTIVYQIENIFVSFFPIFRKRKENKKSKRNKNILFVILMTPLCLVVWIETSQNRVASSLICVRAMPN